MTDATPEYDETTQFRITHHLRTRDLTFTGLKQDGSTDTFVVDGVILSDDIVLVPRLDETYFVQIASKDSSYGEFVTPYVPETPDAA